jgi:hypothetical protein
LRVSYVVLDGAFGNNYALQMVRRCQFDLGVIALIYPHLDTSGEIGHKGANIRY